MSKNADGSCSRLSTCFTHDCTCYPQQPAPVSATEVEDVLREFKRIPITTGGVYTVNVDAMAREIITLRARVAALERVTEDTAIIDALAAREIEVECMGTTVPYWNVVVVKTGEMFTASPSDVRPVTLREALTRALTAARGGG